MANILAVDDDEDILLLIKNALVSDGHTVFTQKDPEKLYEISFTKFDLIILDVMMPGIDGFSLCKEIRRKVDCPIIFLTAKSLDHDVEYGFLVGGDDYVKKPFSIVELRARVNAHLRREKREHTQTLTIGNIEFRLLSKEIYVNNIKLSMTKSEYLICELLTKHRPQIYSKEQIYEAIFGFDGESDESTIKEHIKNIRKKLNEQGENPIETVWGIGYRWK